MSSSTLRCPRHVGSNHTGPVFLNTKFILAGSHDETVNRPHAGVKKLCRFAPQPYMPDPCGWTTAPNRRMWMTRVSPRTAFIVFVDRSLVFVDRSLVGNGCRAGIPHIKLPGSRQRTMLDEGHGSITQAHQTIQNQEPSRPRNPQPWGRSGIGPRRCPRPRGRAFRRCSRRTGRSWLPGRCRACRRLRTSAGRSAGTCSPLSRASAPSGRGPASPAARR